MTSSYVAVREILTNEIGSIKNALRPLDLFVKN